MKIGIIGAGFTGLTAAYELQKRGHTVVVFEKNSEPGGLAIGFKEKKWNWTLEEHYHHWFTNDDDVLSLAKEIDQEVIIKRPKTSIYLGGEQFQLDSPLALLTFPKLPVFDRVRMCFALALLRFNPFWKLLEGINANKFLTLVMGEKAYGMLWEPQLRNKMGKFADDVSLVWFWSRIKKRTPSLAYPKGGFLSFARLLSKTVRKNKGVIHFSTTITSLKEEKEKATISFNSGKGQETNESFDAVIVTLPSFQFLKIAPHLPDTYKNKLIKLRGLGATNLVIRLRNQFLKDNTYWLSICEKNAPVMVIVEHTNFMDKKQYANEHIIYIGNYPESTSKEFAMNEKELLTYYDSLLTQINPTYKKDIISMRVFKAPFAQPIIPLNYSKHIPSYDTPLAHVYLANIEQVYPWDRGTNYAVELGRKITNHILSKEQTS